MNKMSNKNIFKSVVYGAVFFIIIFGLFGVIRRHAEWANIHWLASGIFIGYLLILFLNYIVLVILYIRFNQKSR